MRLASDCLVSSPSTTSQAARLGKLYPYGLPGREPVRHKHSDETTNQRWGSSTGPPFKSPALAKHLSTWRIVNKVLLEPGPKMAGTKWERGRCERGRGRGRGRCRQTWVGLGTAVARYLAEGQRWDRDVAARTGEAGHEERGPGCFSENSSTCFTLGVRWANSVS